MRAFVVSLTMLLVLTAFVIGNCIYVGRVSDSLLTEVEALPDEGTLLTEGFGDTAQAVSMLRQRWEFHRELLGIGVHFDYLSSITYALISLDAFAQAEDVGEYGAARELVIEAIKRMQSLEKPSISNFF